MSFALVLAFLSLGAGTDDDLRALLEERIASGHQPGIVVGVVDGEKRRILGAGVAFEGGPKVNGDTVFEIGSVSKVFTATLLAQMAAAGEVGLDDPIAKYLPVDAKVPSRSGKAITLRHLATHRSGLPRMPTNITARDAADPYADYGAAAMLALLGSLSLERDPGEAYEYSNLGAGLLGHLLATRAGLSFEQLLRERIFVPLGMNDTAVVLPPRLSGRLAHGHSLGEPVSAWAFDVLAGAGGIRSTANDLLRFVAAFAGGRFTKLGTSMLEATVEADAPNVRIGLGWHVTRRFGLDLVWHNGLTGGFASYVGFERGTRHGVVVLTNGHQGLEEIGLLVLDPRRLAARLPPVPKQQAVSLDGATLDRYVGRYALAPGAVFTITRAAEGLEAQLTGQAAIPLFATSATEFFYKIVEARLVFTLEKNRVTGLVLHQGGRAMPAKRLVEAAPSR